MEFLWVVGPLILTPVFPTGIFVFPLLSLSLSEHKSDHIILDDTCSILNLVSYGTLSLLNFCWHSTEFKMHHASHRASCPSSCCSSCGSASTSISWSCSSSGGFCALSTAWASQNSLVAEIGQCLFNLHTPNPPWSRRMWDCSVLLPLPFQLRLPHFGDIPKPSLPSAQKVCEQLHQAGFRPKMCPRHWAPWSCRRSACSAWQSPWPPAEFGWIVCLLSSVLSSFLSLAAILAIVFWLKFAPGVSWDMLTSNYKHLYVSIIVSDFYPTQRLPANSFSTGGKVQRFFSFRRKCSSTTLCKPCMKLKAGHASDDFYRMSQGIR